MDITDVTDVINFDLPGEPFIYVHRVGRSARMGNTGNAFTIINEDEMDAIKAIERTVKIHMMRIELNQDPYLEVGRDIGYSHYKNRENNGGRGNRSFNRSGDRRPPRRSNGSHGNGRRFNNDRRN